MTVLVLAVGLDLLVGDPSNRWHPVAWIGRLITLARARAPRSPEDLALYGTFLVLIVAGLAAGSAPRPGCSSAVSRSAGSSRRWKWSVATWSRAIWRARGGRSPGTS